MTEPNTTTPAGWYPDGSEAYVLRYWDGAAWTAHTAPDTTTPPPSTGPRNAYGIWALVVGVLGMVLGLVPPIFPLTFGAGMAAVILGVAGWRRARRGEATNTKVAVAGFVAGVLAVAMSIAGVVITVGLIDSIAHEPGVSRTCQGQGQGQTYGGQLKSDVCAGPDGTATVGPYVVTVGSLAPDGAGSICAPVTIENTSREPADDLFDLSVQSPDSEGIGSGSPLGFDLIDPGATASGAVCTGDTGARGQYVLIFEPVLGFGDRAVWVRQVT